MMKSFTTFEKLWLFVFTTILLGVSIVFDDTLIGIIATLTGMLNVVLVAKGKMSNFVFGIINVVLYAYISYINNYGGDFVLNLFYYLPMQFVGIYMWRKYINDDVVVGKRFNTKQWLYALSTIVVGTLLITYAMPTINALFGMESNPLPLVDSFTTFASIYAMYLMVKRYQEQWLLWIIINIMSIIMWATIGDITMVVMWSAYLINSVYGYINWRKL